MTESVRVGLISTSWYADSMHLPSLKSHPQAEVAAICGRRRERAEALAQKFDIPQVYTDYREMIDKARLDALIVAAPDDQHFRMVMDGLDAGLHVLCEKPLAYNLAQARQMVARADAAGVQHMVFFTLRWLPHTRYLRELIDTGYVGRLYHCHFIYLSGGGRSGEYKWRYDGARANGILGDLGSHLIDLARWYNGDIARVHAQLAQFVERPGTSSNDSAMLTLEFANGTQAMLHVSAVTHMGAGNLEQRIGLHGAGGTLESTFAFGNFGGSGVFTSVRGARQNEGDLRDLTIPDHVWEQVDPGDPLDVFNKQSAGDRLFIDCILNNRPASPTFHDGLKVQEVIDAAQRSQQSGQWIALGSSEIPSLV